MGLEGIVSKRKDLPYRSGRSPDWLKSKNPAARRCGERQRKIGGDGERARHLGAGGATVVLEHFEVRMPYGLFAPDTNDAGLDG